MTLAPLALRSCLFLMPSPMLSGARFYSGSQTNGCHMSTTERNSILDRIGQKSGKTSTASAISFPSGSHKLLTRENLNIAGMPAKQYLKTVAYKDQIPAFRAVLKDIGESQGWTLDDLRARFSNPLWDYIVF